MHPNIDQVRERRRLLFEDTSSAATDATQFMNDDISTGGDEAAHQQADADDPPLKRLRLSATPTDFAIMPSADEKPTHAQALQLFVSQLHMTCAMCSQDVTEDFHTSVKRYSAFEGDATFAGILSQARCLKCAHLTCLGCGVLTGSHNRPPGWHCARGRMAYVWHVLCLYDGHASHKKALSASAVGKHASAAALISKSKDASFEFTVDGQQRKKAGSGTGYSGYDEDSYSNHSHGHYYGHAHYLEISKANQEALLAEARTKLLEQDMLIAAANGLCRALLEQQEGATSSPADPILDSMLLCSSVLGRLATVVQNATIEDIEKRSRFYVAVGSLLATLSDCTKECLAVSQQAGGDTRNILEISFGRCAWVANTKGLSLIHLIEDLAVRCRLVLSADAQTSIGVEASQVCNGFVKLANDFICATAPKPSAVQSVPDDAILKVHRHAQEATEYVTVLPRRVRRLFDELSILTTSLPPGIFVRHCESRLDVLKVLIIGPQDTPYANGLFEFDIFCPGGFPQRPPKMFFRTTSNGTVSFNPNLYPDGMVCLSLLGTFSGEPWIPEQSSLLQLLVSVQAMIFCEEPFTNEPSQASTAGSTFSQLYNLQIRAHTVQHAMVDWLTQKEPSIWKDIIDEHFASRGGSIEKTVREWLAELQAAKPAKFKGTGTAGRVLGEEKVKVKQEETGEQTVVQKLQALVKEMQNGLARPVGLHGAGIPFQQGMFNSAIPGDDHTEFL